MRTPVTKRSNRMAEKIPHGLPIAPSTTFFEGNTSSSKIRKNTPPRTNVTTMSQGDGA
jgi:hypothetical protein